MMRIDSHHHVWDLAVREQDWMVGDALKPISKTFTMADMEPELEAASIDYTVIVQTVAVMEETPEFLTIAAEHPKVAAVVGWLDMEAEDITPALESHLSHPEAHRLVSIRDLAQYQEDPRWLMRPNIVRNVQRLGERGLSFDILTLAPQLAAAVDLVAACPDTQFVLDHISKPNIAAGDIDGWEKDMKALGELPNVVVKVSGMVTEAKWDNWTVETFRPYVDVVTENFGPQRMMFGSDWPVCLLGGTYQDIVGIVETITADWSASEKEFFWSTTAINAYRLKDLLS
ncbi:MAG: amidohydrolase family protein [Pontimonas sp.]|nr:amidohydrolase family protein [Pontimonas sp.]